MAALHLKRSISNRSEAFGAGLHASERREAVEVGAVEVEAAEVEAAAVETQMEALRASSEDGWWPKLRSIRQGLTSTLKHSSTSMRCSVTTCQTYETWGSPHLVNYQNHFFLNGNVTH